MRALPQAVLLTAAVAILLLGIAALAVGDVTLGTALAGFSCILLAATGFLRDQR